MTQHDAYTLTNQTDEDARAMAAKYLSKYRPQFIEAATNGDGTAIAAS